MHTNMLKVMSKEDRIRCLGIPCGGGDGYSGKRLPGGNGNPGGMGTRGSIVRCTGSQLYACLFSLQQEN